MIISTILDLITFFVSIITHLLPTVTTLPNIAGFNIDSALVSGVGQLNQFTNAFWPIADMLFAFFALVSYYILKKIAILILGSRSPAGN